MKHIYAFRTVLFKPHFLSCRLLSDPSIDNSGPVAIDHDEKEEEETEKSRMIRNKVENTKHEAKGNFMFISFAVWLLQQDEEVGWLRLFFVVVLIHLDGNKKPRMRTADDVISRILWDPVVDSSEFVVGYVDRFLGVLERPFNDFTWDTNPCDCDYSAELALPRHRIQYFTYRGHRVWDRHTRTDRVFGSTGQSLAPPFGRVEEVNGKTETFSSTLILLFIFTQLE